MESVKQPYLRKDETGSADRIGQATRFGAAQREQLVVFLAGRNHMDRERRTYEANATARRLSLGRGVFSLRTGRPCVDKPPLHQGVPVAADRARRCGAKPKPARSKFAQAPRG